MVRIQHAADNRLADIQAAGQCRLADTTIADSPVEGKLTHDPERYRHWLLPALEARWLWDFNPIGHRKSDAAAKTINRFLNGFVGIGAVGRRSWEIGKAHHQPSVFVTLEIGDGALPLIGMAEDARASVGLPNLAPPCRRVTRPFVPLPGSCTELGPSQEWFTVSNLRNQSLRCHVRIEPKTPGSRSPGTKSGNGSWSILTKKPALAGRTYRAPWRDFLRES